MSSANKIGFDDPITIAKMVSSYGINADTQIFDMGCGTGLVGETLRVGLRLQFI